MIHFKNHNPSILPGFAFIEIIIAIILLAIFGSSLFMTQARIFSTVARAHNKVVQTLQSTAMLPEFILKKMDTVKEKKPLESIILHKEIKYPPIIIDEKIKKIPEKSELFKDFGNYLQLVDQTIDYDDKKSHMIRFIFTPPVEKKDEGAAKGITNQTAKSTPIGFE